MDTLPSNLTWVLVNPTFWCLTISIAVYAYIKYITTINYWPSRGVSGPKPKFGSGNFHSFVNTPFNEVHTQWSKEYGRFFGIMEARRPVLITTDPDVIKEVFIKNGHIFIDRRPASGEKLTRIHLFFKRGDDWKADRRIMSPSFTSGKMKAMFALMFDCYKKMDEELQRVVKADKEVDAKILFGKLTSTVIARCAFATVIDPYIDENDPLLKHLHGLFKIGKFRMVLFQFLPGWIKNVFQLSPTPEANRYLKQVCMAIVKQRRENGNSGPQNYSDLVQLLLDAGHEVTEEVTAVPDHESHHGMENDPDAVKSMDAVINNSSNTKKTLTEDEIIANVILFFIAGFETTSTLLNFASFVLTTQPDIQERLYQELKATFDEKGGHFDYETLASHATLDSFICETLRFYPPILQIERMARDEYRLSNGFLVKKNDLIVAPLYPLQHDPEFYEEPEKFDMDRFLPQNRGKIIPCTYLPFGTGPRNCIGMRFALMEAKMALANMMIKYKFVSTSKTTRELKFKPMSIILTNQEPIMVKVERR